MSTSKATLPHILRQDRDTKKLTLSYLETKDLCSLASTSKHSQLFFSKEMADKKKAKQLLIYVFNADPKSATEFLLTEHLSRKKSSGSPGSPVSSRSSGSNCIVLLRSRCKEGYFSHKLKREMTKRLWQNISPLEAAAWCGDNFLVKLLLSYVPDCSKRDAANQLQGILDRKESNENGGYLAPFKALLNAYQKATDFMDLTFNFEDGKNWKKMKDLWHQIWIKQRMLPIYGLQEYCDHNVIDIRLSTNKEPKRSCLYWTLDLDSMPYGERLHLYAREEANSILAPDGLSQEDMDFEALNRLCEIRAAELNEIIKSLCPMSFDKETESREGSPKMEREKKVTSEKHQTLSLL